MKRQILWMFTCALAVLLVLLVGCTIWLGRNRMPEPPQTEPATTAGTTTAPTTRPTAVPTSQPTEPPLDTEAVISELAALTEDAQPELLRWILDNLGQDVLLALRDAVRDGYDRQDWYTATGNTLAVLADMSSGAVETEDNIHFISMHLPGMQQKTTTLVFGGDICLADNYLPVWHMNSAGHSIDTCIDPALVKIMRDADVTFLNNEFTISDRGTPMAGKTYTFRAATANTAWYKTLGVDIVSLANNHAFDFGEAAFLDTLDTLENYGLAQIGGGRNLEEAQKIQYYIINGRKIAYVAATRAEKNVMTPAAGEDSPGVLRCYDTALTVQAIREARENSDFVIACIHWGTEYSYTLEKAQTDSARVYIDAGADLIVGAHAHQLQGIEFYNGKAIFYNLGNFWFNAYEIDTGLLQAQINPDGTAVYTFLPALQKDCHTTSQIGTDRGAVILETLRKYSIHTSIDESGVVTEE